MKKILIGILLVLVSARGSAATAGMESAKLDAAWDFQNTPVWCWAACIQLALRSYDIEVAQAEIVAKTYGSPVNLPANWMQITNNLNYLAQTDGRKVLVSSTVYMGSPSAEAIINHLKNRRPILMSFNNPGTFMGHVVLVTAVDYHFMGERAVIDSIVLRDPFPYSPQHVAAHGRIVIPNMINPTNIWLVDATLEN